MGVEPADLIVLDLADIGRAGAKIGNPDNGVRGRATGHLGRRTHVAVDRCGARLVDQGHAALGHAVAAKKLLVGLHQHVENRVADRQNVVFCLAHSSKSCVGSVYGDFRNAAA